MWWWMGTCTIHMRIMVSQVHLGCLKFSSQFQTFHNNPHTHCNKYCYSQSLALGKELPTTQTTDLPCVLWAEISITQTWHIFTCITSSEVTTRSRSRWESLTLHRSLTKQEHYSTSEHFPGWVIALPAQQHCHCTLCPQPPGPSTTPEPGSPHLASSSLMQKWEPNFPFARGEGQSPTTVAPLIWMLTHLLQVTFVISHGMQTSDNTGRDGGGHFTEEEMHIFHITSAQLSIIVLCKIF